MDKRIIDIWADIGTKEYWTKFLRKNNRKGIFVPFECRWPQPGFIGRNYFDLPVRVVVMGQNPNSPEKQGRGLLDDDKVMFNVIQKHSKERSSESLESLFALMPEFMLGSRYVEGERRKGWKSITAVDRHLDLCLDDIAYLNLNPLTLVHKRIVSEYREAFEHSTKKQLQILNPDKIVFYGKGAHDRFVMWTGGHWDVRYIEQRNLKDVPSVRMWLNS